MTSFGRRAALRYIGGAVAASATFGVPSIVAAKTATVRLAYQLSLNYLPFMVCQHEKLIEANLKRDNIDATISWAQFTGGGAMDTALLAGQVDIAAGGITVCALLWDKTKQRVKGVTSLASAPMYLNVNKSSIKSLSDFTETDRIAVPAARISPNAIVCEMAAKSEEQRKLLDSIIISMDNPDAYSALVGGNTEISAHMAPPPFCFEEITKPGIQRVLNSKDILGEGASTIVSYAKSDFMETNPAAAEAFVSAIEKAAQIIGDDPKRAANIYANALDTKQPAEGFEQLISQPDIKFSAEPRNSLAMISYMHEQGLLKSAPSSWKELFFPAVQSLGGS
jgi:NitT/TauT family transport system substrate-binding protein